LDSIRSINPKQFVTGSQDGSVSLWAANKSKAIHSIKQAHGDAWVTAVVRPFLLFQKILNSLVRVPLIIQIWWPVALIMMP